MTGARTRRPPPPPAGWRSAPCRGLRAPACLVAPGAESSLCARRSSARTAGCVLGALQHVLIQQPAATRRFASRDEGLRNRATRALCRAWHALRRAGCSMHAHLHGCIIVSARVVHVRRTASNGGSAGVLHGRGDNRGTDWPATKNVLQLQQERSQDHPLVPEAPMPSRRDDGRDLTEVTLTRTAAEESPAPLPAPSPRPTASSHPQRHHHPTPHPLLLCPRPHDR